MECYNDLLREVLSMKIEIGKDFPQYFKPLYPEEFELFSHFEVTAGIPTLCLPLPHGKKTVSLMSVFIPGAVSMEIRLRSLL